MGLLRRSSLFAVSILALLLGVALLSSTNVSAADPGVSESPRLDVMQVIDGEVLDSTLIGNRVIVVGTFTKVRNAGGGEVTQPYIAAYDIDTGQFDASFRPALDRYASSVASSEDETFIFVGGNFIDVNGETHRKIAKLTETGGVVSSFNPQANGTVFSIAADNGKLYVGGRFTTIDAIGRTGLAAIDADTGDLDQGFDFDFDFSVASGGGITTKMIKLTPDGSKMFVSHTARFIDGQERTAIARFDVSPNSASLSSWQTNLYDDELDRFGGALRPRRIAISPDGTYLVMVTSGGDRPPAGDTAVRFPVSGAADVQPAWVSRHFDTVLGVAISDDSVFVGGHFQFQEAPGSTDPYPGDQFTNYGFGFGQGPAQLGDEVVPREQLGSLDPATGKSQPWNPGSDSFIGVQSLTFVPGKGLLVGHDGNRLGGATVGRHAIFPVGDGPVDPPDGGYTCSTAVDGSDVVLTFTGERGGSENLLRNGGWTATVTGLPNIRINNAAGDVFAVRVRGPNFANPFADIPCTPGDPGGVTLDTSITAPTAGAVVAPGNVTLTGEASAPGGISLVRLSVVRRTDTMYLTADGSFTSTWAAIDVTLNTNDEERSWTQTLNLTDTGEYKITAKTFAADGSRDESRAERKFVVGATTDDPPVLTVTGPANPSPGSTAIIEGTVTDDLGVSSVTFTMRERDLNLYLRPDGTLGSQATFSAGLSNPGSISTSFSSTLTNVPVGEWEVRVEARDSSGQRFLRIRSYSQIGDTAPPTIVITNGTDQKKPANSQFAFSGSAQADAGIESIETLIRNVVDYSGVQVTGNLGSRANYYVLPGSNGGTAKDWSYETPPLGPGTYDVFVRVTDQLGARATQRTLLVVGPAGDELPTTTFTGSLRYQQGVDSLTVLIGGTASDDVGVGDVTIGIFDFVDRVWLQTDGTTDSIPDPFSATLSAPGSTSTDWSFEFTAPKSNTYYFYVRAVDSSAQAADVRTFGSARIYPGDSLPTVTTNLPTANQTITSNRIAVSGSANDDISVIGVEILIYHADSAQYLRADGSLGGVEWIQASLTNPGGDRSNFDYQTPVIPDGKWDVIIRSRDNNTQTTLPVTRLRVTLT